MSIIKVSCPNNIAFNAFSGEINFIFKVPNQMRLIPNKCKNVKRIRVTQTSPHGVLLPGLRPFVAAGAVGTPTAITIPYLNRNPITASFTAVRTSILSHQVTNDDYVQCGDTLLKMLTRSKEEEKTIEPNNAVIPISKFDCYTNTLFSCRQLYQNLSAHSQIMHMITHYYYQIGKYMHLKICII